MMLVVMIDVVGLMTDNTSSFDLLIISNLPEPFFQIVLLLLLKLYICIYIFLLKVDN